MIQSNELKINNRINHTNKNGSFYFEVIEVLALGVNVIYNKGIWFIKYEEIEPIPLTEEWLLKFGFEKKKFYLQLNETYISKDFDTNTYDYQIVTEDGMRFTVCEIKYVHQLQNLYFALTEQELEIK